jgi:hypothetical protein
VDPEKLLSPRADIGATPRVETRGTPSLPNAKEGSCEDVRRSLLTVW